MTQDVYEKVTEKLIAAMESGTVPWAKPWRGGAPMSVHGHVYRGINALILAFSGYESPIWMTFQQARALGGSVKKGEKGTPVMLWKPTKGKADAETGEEKAGLFCTSFTVFNFEQTEGVTLPAALRTDCERPAMAPVDAAEALIARYSDAPEIITGGGRAAYSPLRDVVMMPARSTFKTICGYYSTLFHELAHSTGHASRLGREGITNFDAFGSHQYSREELIAEMSAAFMCAQTGIENEHTVQNTAAYLKNWLGIIKGDRKILVQAASAAQKAVDHISGASAAKQAEAA